MAEHRSDDILHYSKSFRVLHVSLFIKCHPKTSNQVISACTGVLFPIPGGSVCKEFCSKWTAPHHLLSQSEEDLAAKMRQVYTKALPNYDAETRD